MTHFPARLAALLLLAAFFVAVLWSNDINPCGGQCRARFSDLTGATP